MPLSGRLARTEDLTSKLSPQQPKNPKRGALHTLQEKTVIGPIHNRVRFRDKI